MASTSFPKKKKRYLVIKEANQVFWYVVIRIELFQHVITTVTTPIHLTNLIWWYWTKIYRCWHIKPDLLHPDPVLKVGCRTWHLPATTARSNLPWVQLEETSHLAFVVTTAQVAVETALAVFGSKTPERETTWVKQTPNWVNLQKMLMNMPSRTTVIVESRICHQVTSRVTSSDLSKVLQVLGPCTHLSLQSGLPSLFLVRAMHSPLLHLHIFSPSSCTTNHHQQNMDLVDSVPTLIMYSTCML